MTWLGPIKNASRTYRYRDPDKRRAQMREIMRRRRARRSQNIERVKT